MADWNGPAMQALRASGYSNASRSKLVQGDVESLEWSDNRKFRCLGLGIIWRIPDAALSAMTARCRDLAVAGNLRARGRTSSAPDMHLNIARFAITHPVEAQLPATAGVS